MAKKTGTQARRHEGTKAEAPPAPEQAAPEVMTEQSAADAIAAEEPGQAPEAAVDTAAQASSAAPPDPADESMPPTQETPAEGEDPAATPPARDEHFEDLVMVVKGDDVTIAASVAELLEPPNQPSIDSVMGGLVPECPGAVITRPEVYLTGEQAVLQLRVYETLCKQGKTLRSQGDVYGWLLGQMLEHLGA